MKRILVFIFFLSSCVSFSQEQDTSKLPFSISKLKHLSDEDLANKKEGTYITGVPDISSDPINGFGAGVEGQIFFDGKKSNPFFAYTPYNAELSLAVFYTSHAQRELRLSLDMPYAFHSRWRLFTELGYEVNPNLLYFGLTEKSLAPLSYYPNNDSTKSPVTNASYRDYENSQTGKKAYYNTYQKEEKLFNAIAQRSFLDGKMQTEIGYEIGQLTAATPLNKISLVASDAAAGKINGFGKSIVSILQFGLVYDTRDLETDPSKGVSAELLDELALKEIGSQFSFNKTALHLKLFQPMFPKVFRKCILAARLGIGYVTGNAPFIEYMDQEAGEETISVLGGSSTLRGYKQNRFVGNVMSFSNVELRCRFWQINFLKQHLTWSAVPFFDAGGAWDNFSRVSHTENIRYAEGLGLRIAWNNNTILRFDYAVSKEDQQFFFGLGHSF